MSNKFDELIKGLAQSSTRRAALKKFGVGLAGAALAWLGLASNAQADPAKIHCRCNKPPNWGCDPNSFNYSLCFAQCSGVCSP